MKTKTFALLMTCLGLGVSAEADVLLFEDFEDNVVTFTASDGLFHDGTSDYFTIVPLNNPANPSVPFSGFAGNNYFAAEDLDDGGTRPATQTLSFNVDIAGFENLTLSSLFAAGGNDASPAYDSNDGFLIRASIDADPFQNLLAFEAIGTTNQLLRQDADFDGTGDVAGFQPSEAMTSFADLVILGTGSTLNLEIVVSSNDGNGEFAFDNVLIQGDAVPEPSTLAVAVLALGGLARRRRHAA